MDDCVQKNTLGLPLAAELFLLFSAFHVLLVSFKNYPACVQAYNFPVQLTNHCDVPFITTFALPPMWAAACFFYQRGQYFILRWVWFLSSPPASPKSLGVLHHYSVAVKVACWHLVSCHNYLKIDISPQYIDNDVYTTHWESPLLGSLACCCCSCTFVSGNCLCEHWVYFWNNDLRFFFSY